MNPTENEDVQSTEGGVSNTYIEGQLGSVRTPTNFPVAIACLTAGLFLGTYLTKRAPVSLIISSS